MKTSILIALLQFAGLLHIGLICAGALMPRVVNLRVHLADRPPFIRQLFWTYYLFIGLFLVSFGSISYFLAALLANGSPLAKAVCLFLAAFWSLRLIAATFILNVNPYLTTPYRRLGYHATNIAFIVLPIIYLVAALASE